MKKNLLEKPDAVFVYAPVVEDICIEFGIDKSDVETDLSHDLVIPEEALSARYLRLTVFQVPYQQKPCISGFRVFGHGGGEKPGGAASDDGEWNGLMRKRFHPNSRS